MTRETKQLCETRGKYFENRANFPAENLRKYAGKWIAWNADGSRIALSADDPDELYALIDASGIDPAEFITEGVPAGDTVISNWFDEGQS